jgi:hypothetical protein
MLFQTINCLLTLITVKLGLSRVFHLGVSIMKQQPPAARVTFSAVAAVQLASSLLETNLG